LDENTGEIGREQHPGGKIVWKFGGKFGGKDGGKGGGKDGMRIGLAEHRRLGWKSWKIGSYSPLRKR